MGCPTTCNFVIHRTYSQIEEKVISYVFWGWLVLVKSEDFADLKYPML